MCGTTECKQLKILEVQFNSGTAKLVLDRDNYSFSSWLGFDLYEFLYRFILQILCVYEHTKNQNTGCSPEC